MYDCMYYVQLMYHQDLLSDIESWNTLLAGVLHTGHLPTWESYLQQLADGGVQPNLHTFTVQVDGLISMQEQHAYSLAIYDVWRQFVKESGGIQPDIKLLNKLLYCSRMCGHVERALFFLNVAHQCKLSPDLDSFRQLLMVRYDNVLCMCGCVVGI